MSDYPGNGNKMAENPNAAPFWRPAPDPSALTVDMIQTAKQEMRDAFKEAIIAQKDMRTAEIDGIKIRLDSMDKAGDVLADNVNRVPTILDREIQRIQDLFSEKLAGVTKLFETMFDGVQTQFVERDERTKSSDDASKLAIKDALQAQKESAGATQQSNAEAISKSEAGFGERIKALETLIASTKSQLDSSIVDLRRSIDRGEGNSTGSRETRADSQTNTNTTVNIVLGCIAGLSLLVAVVAIFESRQQPSLSPNVVAVTPK